MSDIATLSDLIWSTIGRYTAFNQARSDTDSKSDNQAMSDTDSKSDNQAMSDTDSKSDNDLQGAKFVQKLKKRIECGVCKDMYKIPRRLECDHSFCERCLERLNYFQRIKCPMCREVTRLPHKGVTGLKKNLDLIGIADDFADQKSCLSSINKLQPAVCVTHHKPKVFLCKYNNREICISCKHTKEHSGHGDVTLQEHIEYLSKEAERQFCKIEGREYSISRANAHFKELQRASQFQKNESIEEIEKEKKWVLEVIKKKYDRLKQRIQISNDEVSRICNRKIEENHAEEKYIEDKRKELESLKELAKSQLDETVTALDRFIGEVEKKEVKVQRSGEDEKKVFRYYSFVFHNSFYSAGLRSPYTLRGMTPVSDKEISSIVKLLAPFKRQISRDYSDF